MKLKSKFNLLLPLLIMFLNVSNAQSNLPLRGQVLVDDGYTIRLTKYDKTIDYYVIDSLQKPVSVKKIEASAMFKYTDKTSSFKEGSKNKKENVFTSEIPNEKDIEMIGILIKIANKKYVAAFPYPKQQKLEK